MRHCCRIHTCAVATAIGLAAAPGLFVPGAVAQQKLLEPHQSIAVPSGSLSVNKWCADHRRGAAQGASDLIRLKEVQSELAPRFDPGGRRGGIDLIAAYQQELERSRPDRASAATYLALVSTVPITFGVVERVNHLLCVSSTRAFAEAVAETAESERQSMRR